MDWFDLGYWEVWNALYQHVLQGMPWRIFTMSLWGSALWLSVYRQRIRLALLMYFVSLVSAYLHHLMAVVGME